SFEDYSVLLPTFFTESEKNNYDASQAQLAKLNTMYKHNADLLAKLYRSVQDDANATIDASYRDSNRFNYEILILSVIASIFSTIIAFF
ncbi:hypothetical protein RYX56_22890, partial [Alkalihalophilus lindianensis]